MPDDEHPAPAMAMATNSTATHVHRATHLANEDAIDRLPGVMS